MRKDSLFLGLYESVNKCTSQTLLTRGPFAGAIWNNSSILMLYKLVDECTRPLVEHRSMYAIQNNSSFLGLYELVDECTSPPVKHLPHIDDSCMQSGTTPHF